jgi:hypothetical protein
VQKAKDITKADDSTPEEIKDVKEFYANKSKHKTGSLKELLKDLKE